MQFRLHFFWFRRIVNRDYPDVQENDYGKKYTAMTRHCTRASPRIHIALPLCRNIAQKPAAEFYDQDHDEEFTEHEEKKHPKKHAQKNAEARKKKRGDLVYTIAMVVFAVIFLVSGGCWLSALSMIKRPRASLPTCNR